MSLYSVFFANFRGAMHEKIPFVDHKFRKSKSPAKHAIRGRNPIKAIYHFPFDIELRSLHYCPDGGNGGYKAFRGMIFPSHPAEIENQRYFDFGTEWRSPSWRLKRFIYIGTPAAWSVFEHLFVTTQNTNGRLRNNCLVNRHNHASDFGYSPTIKLDTEYFWKAALSRLRLKKKKAAMSRIRAFT